MLLATLAAVSVRFVLAADAAAPVAPGIATPAAPGIATPAAPSIATPAAPAMPAPLQCLARLYAVTPERQEHGWHARLPDGRRLRYDDAAGKSFEQRLERPDLEDMFAVPYRAGPIVPVTTAGDDPGRVRVEPLFEATYGASARQVALVSVRFFGARLQVHRKVAPALARVVARLTPALAADDQLAPLLRQPGGGFAWRSIAGTQRRSTHAYGIAIDLNPRRAEYWRWQRVPEPRAGATACPSWWWMPRSRGLHLGRTLVSLRHHALRTPARVAGSGLRPTAQRAAGGSPAR